MELNKYPVLQSASLAGCSARRRWWVCWGTPRWSPASKTTLISRLHDTSSDRNGSSVATDDWQTNKPTLESIVRIKWPCSEELISAVRHDERQWRQWTMENSIYILELTLCTSCMYLIITFYFSHIDIYVWWHKMKTISICWGELTGK